MEYALDVLSERNCVLKTPKGYGCVGGGLSVTLQKKQGSFTLLVKAKV